MADFEVRPGPTVTFVAEVDFTEVEKVRSATLAIKPSYTAFVAKAAALATCDTRNNAQWRTFSTLITRLPAWLSKLAIRLPYFFPHLWCKYRGAALLISSPAKYGVDAVLAATSFPLGLTFGLVKPRPIVCDGALGIATTTTLVLTFDRRIMAGAHAARFFKRIIDVLEHAGIWLEPAAVADATDATQCKPSTPPAVP